MQTQISQFMSVDPNYFPENEQIVIGDRSIEGGFLTHYFINLCLKQNRSVCFLALSQTFTHYNSVAQKLGLNLLTACNETKNFKFIEGLKCLGSCFDSTDIKVEDSKPFLDLINGDCSTILRYIESAISSTTEFVSNSCHGPVVIIDDLSILLSAGLDKKDVILFYNGLTQILDSQKGSLITFSYLEKDDDDLEELWSFVSHVSTIRIEFSALSSGFCKDVHGQMKVEWRDGKASPRKFSVKQTQFKLSDKTVDFFASGMSAAVL